MGVPFPANPHRLDPYKNFKFRLKWDGKYVYGGSKVTGLKRTTEVVEHRNGGDPSTSHKSPGRTKYEAITLERGLTGPCLSRLGRTGVELRFGIGLRSVAGELPQGHLPGVLQRSWTASDCLQNLSLLGLGVSGDARPRCQRKCHRHRAHQAGKRGLGARYQRDRTCRADANDSDDLVCSPCPVPLSSIFGNADPLCILWIKLFLH